MFDFGYAAFMAPATLIHLRGPFGMRKICHPLAFFALLGACVIFSIGSTYGQLQLRSPSLSTCSNSGGHKGPAPPLFSSQSDPCRRHMGPTGRPCVQIESSARPQTLNANIFEHWVGLTNACGQHIVVKVCYLNSEHCITVDVPPWGRQDKVLGIFPSLREFGYDYTEQF